MKVTELARSGVEKGGVNVLRSILETTLGPMSNAQFAEVMDLTTKDIKINRVGFGNRTSLGDVVGIAVSCQIALGRGDVA